MNESNSELFQENEFTETNGVPSTLNILTILTLIANGLSMPYSVWNYFKVCKNAEELASKELPEGSGFLARMVQNAVELTVKHCENRMIMLVISLLTCALCFVGALLMRQLKKQGLVLYLLGSLLGPILAVLALGTIVLNFVMIFMLLVTAVFIILYVNQRKHLVR